MIRWLFALIFTIFFNSAFAADSTSFKPIVDAISSRYTGSEIEINTEGLVFQGEKISIIQNARVLEETMPGVMHLEVSGTNETGATIISEVDVKFTAWVGVPMAIKRITPHQAITTEDYKIEKINVSSGPYHNVRGILITTVSDLDHAQARYTILEGSPILQNAVEKIPDVQRGDNVRLQVISGNLVLSVEAEAQDSAHIGDRIHVVSTKMKKEFYGILKDEHVVEVTL